MLRLLSLMVNSIFSGCACPPAQGLTSDTKSDPACMCLMFPAYCGCAVDANVCSLQHASHCTIPVMFCMISELLQLMMTARVVQFQRILHADDDPASGVATVSAISYNAANAGH